MCRERRGEEREGVCQGEDALGMVGRGGLKVKNNEGSGTGNAIQGKYE